MRKRIDRVDAAAKFKDFYKIPADGLPLRRKEFTAKFPVVAGEKRPFRRLKYLFLFGGRGCPGSGGTKFPRLPAERFPEIQEPGGIPVPAFDAAFLF